MQPSWPIPSPTPLEGQTVHLLPVDAERDASILFEATHPSTSPEAVWRYLPYGPFADKDAMGEWMAKGFADGVAWTVFDASTQQQVGSVSIISIFPEHGRAEIGHVWFSPAVHRSKVNTETQYLLLCYLFEELRYRRVEWKCDSGNHASRTAAARLGFSYEGRFRQHMVIRGKNRDTDWVAMTDKDWPRCKANLEQWLQSDGSVSLTELNYGVLPPLTTDTITS